MSTCAHTVGRALPRSAGHAAPCSCCSASPAAPSPIPGPSLHRSQVSPALPPRPAASRLVSSLLPPPSSHHQHRSYAQSTVLASPPPKIRSTGHEPTANSSPGTQTRPDGEGSRPCLTLSQAPSPRAGPSTQDRSSACLSEQRGTNRVCGRSRRGHRRDEKVANPFS